MKESMTPINPEKINFCQEPSGQYLKMLEECGEDPRSVSPDLPPLVLQQ